MRKSHSARRAKVQAMETWKPVPGYEGVYEVSDLGRVRRLWSKGHTRIQKGWVVRQSKKQGGRPTYPRVELSRVDDGTGVKIVKRFNLHRLVWIAFRGPIPDGLEINHKDLNKANAALANLELRTPEGNRQHYREHRPPRVPIETQAELRRLAPTVTRKELCERFGLGINTVRKLVGDIAGPCKRKLTPADREAIKLQMRARPGPHRKLGEQGKAIAAAWGVSYATVQGLARREEGPKRKMKASKWKLRLEEAKARGLTASQLAAELRIRPNRVYCASKYWRVYLGKPVQPMAMAA